MEKEFEVLSFVSPSLVPMGLEITQHDQYFANTCDDKDFETDESGKIKITKKVVFDGSPFDIITGPLAIVRVYHPENFCLLKVN